MGDPVPNEFNAANGLSNIEGTIAAARTSNPDSAASGWFINTTNNAAGFDPGPYTVFGTIARGMDLLNAVSFGQPTLYDVFGQANPWLASEQYGTAPLVNGETLFVINRAVEISILDGDFNNDGIVNAADRTLWKNSYGQTGIFDADGNGDYIVDGQDFLLWQRNEGASVSALAAVHAVPEPAAVVLALAAFVVCGRRVR